jgi:hypothetical protein
MSIPAAPYPLDPEISNLESRFFMFGIAERGSLQSIWLYLFWDTERDL